MCGRGDKVQAGLGICMCMSRACVGVGVDVDPHVHMHLHVACVQALAGWSDCELAVSTARILWCVLPKVYRQ